MKHFFSKSGNIRKKDEDNGLNILLSFDVLLTGIVKELGSGTDV